MKFSYRQILASAGGAVLSAVIASVFGVKGTIIGVAIGSVAATTGTALVFQSIERTNQAVKQVVRAPEHTRLLRRLGGTGAAGVIEATPVEGSSLAEETATSASAASVAAAGGDTGGDTGGGGGGGDGGTVDPTGQPAASGPAAAAPGIRWPVVVGAVAAVFLLTLGFVTALELIVGRPLAGLFGHSNGGTTVERIFQTPTTTLPPPTTTTTTTTTTSSTTTTTTSPSSSTTTTGIGGSTTTTTGIGGSTTTTGSSPTGGTPSG